jgi:hypothetical protein
VDVVFETVLVSASSVAASLVGRVISNLRVVRASATVDEDARGEEAIFMDVELEPPPDGAETWPREEFDELRRSIEAELHTQGVDLPTHIRPLSADDPEDLPEEEDDAE